MAEDSPNLRAGYLQPRIDEENVNNRSLRVYARLVLSITDVGNRLSKVFERGARRVILPATRI